MVASTAALQRRIGRLKEAEATAGRLMAFARQVVRDYPDHPESYMVLSEAHFQVSKMPGSDWITRRSSGHPSVPRIGLTREGSRSPARGCSSLR